MATLGTEESGCCREVYKSQCMDCLPSGCYWRFSCTSTIIIIINNNNNNNNYNCRCGFIQLNISKMPTSEDRKSGDSILHDSWVFTICQYNIISLCHTDMKIVQAFPCRCRFADKENAPKVEEEVKNLHIEMFGCCKTYRQSCVFCASPLLSV